MTLTKLNKNDILILGIIFVAFNVRPGITSVGPLIGSIRYDIGISNGLAGLLTTLPLLAFTIISFCTKNRHKVWKRNEHNGRAPSAWAWNPYPLYPLTFWRYCFSRHEYLHLQCPSSRDCKRAFWKSWFADRCLHFFDGTLGRPGSVFRLFSCCPRTFF